MLFHTNETLSEKIVKVLAEHPHTRAYEIHMSLQSNNKCSIQAIYKELRKLQEGGVVVKAENSYALRLPWAIEFVSFADKITEHYLSSPTLLTVLPEHNKREIWHFTNLLRLNDFWSQILLLLIQKSETKVLLGWNPHPWFHLVQTKQEQQYIDSLKRTKSKLYLVIGGNTYLDTWAEKFFDKEIVEYSFGHELFAKQPYYINVIDDYVITVKIDSKTTQSIETLYKSVHSGDDLNIPQVFEIFHCKAKASIWLENNPPKARLLKGKFGRFFGRKF